MAQNLYAEDPEKPKRGRKNWRPFPEAREFARSLGLQNSVGWREYCKSGDRPADIPAHPPKVYKDEWRGWGDWLGSSWRPFTEAREYARSLGFRTQREWVEYCKSGDRPADIPASPEHVYKDAGWNGTRDWLGAEHIYFRDLSRAERWPPWPEAREFARSLGLQSEQEWREYCKSGDKPDDIPSNPDRVYKDEWHGMRDWLGTKHIDLAARRRAARWRPWPEAREFARSLGLEGQKEWREYCGSGAKPVDIPATPWTVYKDDLDELPRDRPIVVYCQTGSRSAVVASALRAAGFDVVELEGGYEGYKKARASSSRITSTFGARSGGRRGSIEENEDSGLFAS